MLVGPWTPLRPTRPSARSSTARAAAASTRARAPTGARIDVLDAAGRVDEDARRRDRPRGRHRARTTAPTWVVTGTDAAGVESAAARLRGGRRSNDRFALAVSDDRPSRCPPGADRRRTRSARLRALMKVGVPKESADGRAPRRPRAGRRQAPGRQEHGGRRRGRRGGAGADPRRAVHRRRGARSATRGPPTWSSRSGRRRAEEIGRLQRGGMLVGFLAPRTQPETLRALAQAGVTAFAMEAIPRISRAQSMDALSSQANVAGYKAALLRRRASPALLPDADDRGGHDPAGQGARARRRASPACRRSPPPGASARRRRATTCAPRSPSRSSRSAPSSSTSGSRPPARAATPAS